MVADAFTGFAFSSIAKEPAPPPVGAVTNTISPTLLDSKLLNTKFVGAAFNIVVLLNIPNALEVTVTLPALLVISPKLEKFNVVVAALYTVALL